MSFGNLIKSFSIFLLILPSFVKSFQDLSEDNYTEVNETDLGILESVKEVKKKNVTDIKVINPRFEEGSKVFILTHRCFKNQNTTKFLNIEATNGTKNYTKNLTKKYEIVSFQNEEDAEYKLYLTDKGDDKKKFDGIGFTYVVAPNQPITEKLLQDLTDLKLTVNVKTRTRGANFKWEQLPDDFKVKEFNMVIVRDDLTLRSQYKNIESFCYMENEREESDKFGDKYLKFTVKGDKTFKSKFIHRGHFKASLIANIESPFPMRYVYETVYFEIGVHTGLVVLVTASIIIVLVASTILVYYLGDKYLYKKKDTGDYAGAAEKLEGNGENKEENQENPQENNEEGDKKND